MDLFAAVGGLAGIAGGYLLPFLFVLVVVIFVHELGHFLVGRWCGIRVTAFSIGFGPEIAGFTDRHGTRWRLAAIPLGGYVKFFGDASAASTPDGDQMNTMTEAEKAVSFHHQPVWKRALTVFAGPAANFLLAIVVFATIGFSYGRQIVVPRVDAVVAGGAAEKAGIKPGDWSFPSMAVRSTVSPRCSASSRRPGGDAARLARARQPHRRRVRRAGVEGAADAVRQAAARDAGRAGLTRSRRRKDASGGGERGASLRRQRDVVHRRAHRVLRRRPVCGDGKHRPAVGSHPHRAGVGTRGDSRVRGAAQPGRHSVGFYRID